MKKKIIEENHSQVILEELKIVKNIAYIMAHTEEDADYDKFLHRIAKDSLNNAITLWKRVKNKNFTSGILDENIDKNGRKIAKQIKKHIKYYEGVLANKITKKERELYEYIIKNKKRHLAILNQVIED